MTENPRTTLTNGRPVYPEHRTMDPNTGMQQDYVVLGKEERAKGFVRPYRRSYQHIGAQPPAHPLQDLTDEEKERFSKHDYVRFEKYPESESPVSGKYWTQKQLDAIGKGCGAVTTMDKTIAETYARDPKFYSGTFCCICKTHFPVAEFVWDGSEELVGS